MSIFLFINIDIFKYTIETNGSIVVQFNYFC